MPVKVAKRGNKYRIVGPGGGIEKTKNGKPRDGGGHASKAAAQKQANAINANYSRKR